MHFVTGGTGLVGAHLLYELLRKGESVRALRRKNSNIHNVLKTFSYYTEDAIPLFAKIEWVEGDLLDINSLREAMQGIDHVYHCAAEVSFHNTNAREIIQNNVIGTANMVDAALQQSIQKFCHVSSIAALGIEKDKDITEETQWNEKDNFSPYSLSKYLSENEVWRASEEGLPVVIINPSVIIGPGDWSRSSTYLFKLIDSGLSWYTDGGAAFVDVRDVAKILVLLSASDVSSQRFIVSSENGSYRSVMEKIAVCFKKPIPTKKADKRLLQLIAALDYLKSKVLGTPQVITQDIARYAGMNLGYANQKIKEILHYDFISIATSIEHTANCFCGNKKNSTI